ncbi:Uncharacterised protein [Megamonas hypermegale]|uniref:Uncharacterized protein n=1 Tax=Megamonas hypermegale TaxID=158847 RepID=A0A239T8X4_9FIRM|nr:hypothetical protein [Megamonas hypermegale]SNU94197.1 Uncharacterised protein [Megamonas hypermegale]
MLVNKKVFFRHGAILTKEMLNVVYDYPRDFLCLKYDKYSDGIISGLDFKILHEDNSLVLTKGIVKYKNELYFLLEDVNLTKFFSQQNLEISRKSRYLQLKMEVKDNKENVQEKLLMLVVLDNAFDERNIPLCRFRWNGSEIKIPKINYSDETIFYDFIDNQSYLNVIDTPYAYLKEATYHSMLFKAIGEYLNNKKNKTILDYIILIQIQNNIVLSMETIKSYILFSGKEKAVVDNCNRKDLFKLFVDCIINNQNETVNKNYEIKKNESKEEIEYGGML